MARRQHGLRARNFGRTVLLIATKTRRGRRFVRGFLFVLVLFRLTACLVSGAVASTSWHHLSHTARHRHPPLSVQPPARVACTVLGCQPIPGSCTPVPGRTPGGLPTGYDVIVCPPGVWPLR